MQSSLAIVSFDDDESVESVRLLVILPHVIGNVSEGYFAVDLSLLKQLSLSF